MFLRAAATAAAALLIGGDFASLGWDALGAWRFCFPYLWLFCALELFRTRRRLGDEEAFLLGTAFSFLYSGVYSKDLHSPDGLLGIDWLATAFSAFDWGLLTVVTLHALEAIRPRKEGAAAGLSSWFVLLFAGGGALCVYAVKTIFHHYRAERGLGSVWLVADILFLWAAWALFRRARDRAELEEAPERDGSVWALFTFAVWLPGFQLVWRIASALMLPEALGWGFGGAWTLAAGLLSWRLWSERAHADPAPLGRSRAVLLAAAWRAAAGAGIFLLVGTPEESPRSVAAFSLAADLPARLLFFWVWAVSRLKV